jgi:hypothetical protein
MNIKNERVRDPPEKGLCPLPGVQANEALRISDGSETLERCAAARLGTEAGDFGQRGQMPFWIARRADQKKNQSQRVVCGEMNPLS